MSLPQIQRKQLAQQQQQGGIQSLLEMNQDSDIPENEKIRQRNPKNLQSKNMTEIFGGRSLDIFAQQTPQVQQPSIPVYPIKRPGSRPELGQRQQQRFPLNGNNNQKPIGGSYQNIQNDGMTVSDGGMQAAQAEPSFNFYDKGEQQQQPQQFVVKQTLSTPDQLMTNNLMKKNQPPYNYNTVDRMVGLYETQDMELKEKMQTQERVVTMLIDQLTNIERSQQGELRKHKMQLDNERDYRIKLESNLRFIQDQYNQLNHELQTKVELLDGKLQRDDRNKTEMREKLILTEQNQKEILFFIRNMQKSETSEILQLRGIMQDKLSDEQSTLQKEREKSKALFMEVVRLGETQERQNETFNNLQGQFESRVAILEAQLTAGQRSVSQIAQKGDQGINYISDWNEKLERRVQQAEGNLLAMNKEQLKDHEQLAELQSYNQRMAADVKAILGQMQADYDSKLDGKVSDMLNRIANESDERTRKNIDIMNTIETKDRINIERQNYEKEELRERYSTLDALLRTELQRKDEAINALQAVLENQVRGLQNALKFEEQSRNSQEIVFRNEILKLQETFAREYDMFKNQQSNVTEKITEMMKIEIQTRLSSDVDLKNLTSAIATDIVSDVNGVKDQLELQYKKTQEELKECKLESSTRSEQVSRYVDEELKRVVELFSGKQEKTKSMFGKLAEQFKNHLVNTETARKETERRTQSIEKTTEDSRNEMYKLLGDTQKAFENRLVEEKLNLQLSQQTDLRTMGDRIDKLTEDTTRETLFIRESLSTQRDSLLNRADELDQKIASIHESNQTRDSELEQKIKQTQSEIQRVRNDTVTLFDEFQMNILKETESINTAFDKLTRNTASEIDLVKANLLNAEQELAALSKEVVGKLNQFSASIESTNELLKTTSDEMQTTSSNLADGILEAIQVVQDFQQQTSNKFMDIQAEMYLDFTTCQAGQSNLKQEITELFDLMNSQHQDFQTVHTRFEQEIKKTADELDDAKTTMFYELQETNDKKIQRMLENMRNEQQRLWQQNVEIADSDFKNIDDLRENKDGLLTQLNEILITQDNYSKPRIRQKK